MIGPARRPKGITIGICLALLCCSLLPRLGETDEIFREGFESGNLAKSTAGFKWAAPNDTSVVSTDAGWENAPGSTGKNALRFQYRPGDEWSEQRFALGGAYPDLWLGFWLRVPTNYSHPDASPNNQKLLAVWMDGYSYQGDGSTIWLGFHASGNGSSTFAATHTSGRFTSSKAYEQTKAFIATPGDRGRWMQIVVHMKAESSAGAADGFMRVWRRWEGDARFAETQYLSGKELRLPANGPQGFAAGYLMGWANAPYPVETNFLIDDFVVSTDSLLDDDLKPMPPTQVVAE